MFKREAAKWGIGLLLFIVSAASGGCAGGDAAAALRGVSTTRRGGGLCPWAFTRETLEKISSTSSWRRLVERTERPPGDCAAGDSGEAIF